MAQRILVVENNAQNRMFLGDLLEFHGFEILEALDGQIGIEMAKRVGDRDVLQNIN